MVGIDDKNLFWLGSTSISNVNPIPYLAANICNSIICYDDVQSISCSIGVISIKSANYGRTDNHTCCHGNTVSNHGSLVCTNNIKCYSNQTQFYKSNCDNKTSCTILFPIFDPCVETYKYLDISWVCLSDGKFTLFGKLMLFLNNILKLI